MVAQSVGDDGEGGYADSESGDGLQGLMAGFGGGTGGEGIIDEEEVPVGEGFGMADGKDACHVVHPLYAVFVGLRGGIVLAVEVVAADGLVEHLRNTLAEQQALVVATMALAKAVQGYRNNEVDVIETMRTEQFFAHHAATLEGKTGVAVILDLMYYRLHHTIFVEIEQRCGCLIGDTAQEALLGTVVGLCGMMCPGEAEETVGAKVVLVAHQRLATMAAQCREQDCRQRVEGRKQRIAKRREQALVAGGGTPWRWRVREETDNCRHN